MPGAASSSTGQNRAPAITHANSVSSVATTAEMGVEGATIRFFFLNRDSVAWRIIPVSNSKHGDRCCPPKDRVVGPLPNSYSWLINGGDPITTYIHWDDPPSDAPPPQKKNTHIPGNSANVTFLRW